LSFGSAERRGPRTALDVAGGALGVVGIQLGHIPARSTDIERLADTSPEVLALGGLARFAGMAG